MAGKLPNIPGLDKLMRMDDNFDVSDEEDNSADFDAELAAIVSGVKPPARKPSPSSKTSAKGPQPTSKNKQQAGVKRQAPAPPIGVAPLDLKELERIAIMNDNFDDGDDEDIGEEDLEAELAALMGTLTPQSPKAQVKPPVPPRSKIIVSTVVVR